MLTVLFILALIVAVPVACWLLSPGIAKASNVIADTQRRATP